MKNKNYYVKIGGIYCNHCRTRIEKAVLRIPGVCSARVDGSIAAVSAKRDVQKELIQSITEIGYIVKPEWICEDFNRWKMQQWFECLGILAGILLFWQLLSRILGFDILNVIPVIDSSISFSAVFAAGLMTSLHCVGMCGAINLVASDSKKNAVLYNGGRVGCYTVEGFLVGLVGNVFSFSNTALGVFTVIVASVMLFMGIAMTGLIPLPRISCFHADTKKASGAFTLGILNGFVPCGPLSAMQLYALSTASPWKGALSLFLFGLGTVPLMLGFGALKNLFEKKKELIQRIMATLVVLLAFLMLLRGFSYLGIDGREEQDLSAYTVAEVESGTQYVRITADYGDYADIAVAVGIPVEFIIEVPEGKLTGCNNEVVCEALGWKQKLSAGENIISFTPDAAGVYTYTCWMHMIQNQILVYETKE